MSGSTQQYNFRDLEILIVDDNDFAHNILRDILLAMKIKKIRHASSASDAIHEIDNKLPDILFVDLLMKPVDGFELIKGIRSHSSEDVRHLPVLVITAYSSVEHVKRARDSGASEVLCKPISVTSVYDRLVYMRNSPRQFVKTEMYTGPDRRRTMRGFEGIDRRQPTDEAADAPSNESDNVE